MNWKSGILRCASILLGIAMSAPPHAYGDVVGPRLTDPSLPPFELQLPLTPEELAPPPPPPVDPFDECYRAVGDWQYCFAVYCPEGRRGVRIYGEILWKPYFLKPYLREKEQDDKCIWSIEDAGGGAIRITRQCFICMAPAPT